MKNYLIIIPMVACLAACSNDTTDEPEPESLNTGRLTAVDAPNYHRSYTYDAEGRVSSTEYCDTSWAIETRCQMDYRYTPDRIYITYQEHRKALNEKAINDLRNFTRDDTLFLKNNRVDSCAGAIRGGTLFYMSFTYNVRGEMTSCHNDNVMPLYQSRRPWYTEDHTYEWANGNIARKTIIKSKRDTTVYVYTFSPLTGNVMVNDPCLPLPDFEPLIAQGYFGTICKNLPSTMTIGDKTWRWDYRMDTDKLVNAFEFSVPDMAEEPGLYVLKWDRKPFPAN